jgi:ATP-dependent Clp protease ATP-binding subunit ClpA
MRRVSRVLQGAVGEALALGRNYVGTEHILLAFYRDSAGVRTTVPQELRLDKSAAWSAIRAVLNELENAK